MTFPVLSLSRLDSPLGEMLLVADAAALVALDFSDCEVRLRRGLARRFADHQLADGEAPAAVAACLADYFAGDFAALGRIVVTVRGTPFQRRIWAELRKVPAGETISYTQLAARAGAPRAVRAAGHANGQNPVSLVLPCHRIVGVDGALTGYAGGIRRKAWLLAHEGARRGPQFTG